MLKFLIAITFVSLSEAYNTEDFHSNGDYCHINDYFKENPSCAVKVRCRVGIRNLPEPSPIFILNNDLKYPYRNSGNLVFEDGEKITVNCGTGFITYPNGKTKLNNMDIFCISGTLYGDSKGKSGTINFSDIKCDKHVASVERSTGRACENSLGIEIEIGVPDNRNNTIKIMTSCLSIHTYKVHYVKYSQGPEHLIYQTVNRTKFKQGQWYPQIRRVDELYGIERQKNEAKKRLDNFKDYFNNTYFLMRGHLAAKTDFPLAPSQRATFTFLNVAPQWNTFKNGNWKTLERDLREHIGISGIHTEIYTGTWGVLHLRNSANALKPIYLDAENANLPVPLWFFKVVHEPSTNRAMAFLGLNNPHASLEDIKTLIFCKDICRGINVLSWLKWKPDSLKLGYSLCCDVNDFKRTVTTLPDFPVSGILLK